MANVQVREVGGSALLAIMFLVTPLQPINCRAAAQNAQKRPIRATVCDLKNAPLKFQGELIELRAQIWWDYHQFWLNESAADSLTFTRSCGWLLAEFDGASPLSGNTAYGTFVGTFVYDQRRSMEHGRLLFVITQTSDLDKQELHNGLISPPALYDQNDGIIPRPR